MRFDVGSGRFWVGWVVGTLALIIALLITASVSGCQGGTEVGLPTAMEAAVVATARVTAVPATATVAPAVSTPTAVASEVAVTVTAVVEVVTEEPLPEVSVEPPVEIGLTPVTEADLIAAFLDAPFRIVAVARPPGSPYDVDFPYTLLVVAQRADWGCGSPEAPARCTDDSNCGSLYTAPICYFFLEPQFVFGANPLPQYVGQWQSGVDPLEVDSLALGIDGILRFDSAGGDGLCGVRASWELDTGTGVVRELERVETCGEE